MKRNSVFQKTAVYGSLAVFCCLLWGSAFPCIKLGYRYFQIDSAETASQLLFAGTRFFIAGIMVILAGSLLQRKPLVPRSLATAGRIVSLSLTQTILQYLFFYIGLAHASGVKSSIIEASNVFFAILVSALVFRMEKMDLQKTLGSLLGFAGVILINLSGEGLTGGMSLQGEGFVLISALCYAVSASMIKIYARADDTVLLSGWQFTFGGLVMMLIGWIAGGKMQSTGNGACALLLYMAFISAAAYTIWGILLKYNPVSRISVFGFSNPLFGVLLSALLLQESSQALSLKGFVSLLLVCMGIFVVNYTGTGKRAVTK